MDDYRLYVLDHAGRIARAHALEAEDDAKARQDATSIASDESWELWAGTRIVARFVGPAFKN
jgi:hypothetical protein